MGALAQGYAVLMTGRVIAALTLGAPSSYRLRYGCGHGGPRAPRPGAGHHVRGLTVANIVGAPAATFLGRYAGWRASFWAVDALAVLARLGVPFLVPRRADGPYAGVRAELSAFRSLMVWVALATLMLTQAAIFCCFGSAVPLLLAGCFAVSVLGGRFADWYLLPNLYIGIAARALVLARLAMTSRLWGATTAVLAFGVTEFSINPALQAQVMRRPERLRPWRRPSTPRSSRWATRSAPGSAAA
jgi:DHA1 family inner membrane transport protein